MVITEIDGIELFVNDMETMVKFYRDIIGFKTNWKGEAFTDFETGNCRLRMYGRNNFENMISRSFDYPEGLNGTMVIAFQVKTYDEVDKEYKRLMDLGVECVFPPATMPWGHRIFLTADPEGNLLEIYA
ncbi:MAG: VOC family protein [Treponema sp.]|nr:VOC family protein [Treponema sp.]